MNGKLLLATLALTLTTGLHAAGDEHHHHHAHSHGEAAPTLNADAAGTEHQLAAIAALGIDLDTVGEVLQRTGLQQFSEAFAKLLDLVR